MGVWGKVRARRRGDGLLSPRDVLLSEGDGLQPDILYGSRERGARARERIEGAPDLVVEVLLPSDRRHDVREKLETYGTSGVIEAWLPEPS